MGHCSRIDAKMVDANVSKNGWVIAGNVSHLIGAVGRKLTTVQLPFCCRLIIERQRTRLWARITDKLI